MSDEGKLLPFKGKKKDEKPDKITQAELFEMYCAILDKNITRGSYPSMPHLFKVFATSSGAKIPIKIDDDGVCHQISRQIIIDALTEYWRLHYRTDDSNFLNPRKAEQVVSHWISGTTPIEEPKAILWADEQGYCYRRLPFTYNADSAFPTLFFEMLKRMTNAAAFCAFIGSLFYEEANRQQYVWIFGGGNNGKGALSRFLHRALAGSYAALSVPKGEHKFWNHQLLDVRLGFFNECSSPGFPTSAFFKTLTGNDPISIEAKGKPIITAKIKTKFIFTSNERPALSNETADHRRAIICEIQEFSGKDDPEYEDKLWAEAQDILSYCCAIYRQHALVEGHRAIPVCVEDLLQYSAEEDDYFGSIFAQHLVISKDDYVSGEKIGDILREVFGKMTYEARQFRAWMMRHCGVTYCRKSDMRRYYGIKVNSNLHVDLKK